ncbi:MAG TPA: hypothetical protein VGR48_13115 [Terriglobales bacterium]|nr:hypothetical protein [Terriglobales bacterium]
MLAKCANPACTAPFLYLREGKLYQIEVGADTTANRSSEQNADNPPVEDRKLARRLEFFWLCGRCATQMTLALDRGGGVVVVPTRTQGAIAS